MIDIRSPRPLVRRRIATVLAVAAIAVTADASAQDDEGTARPDASKERASIGLDVRRFQDDFGVGAAVSTPFIGRWIRFTLGGGAAWFPHAVSADGTERWETFGHARFVVEVGPTFQRGSPVRPYGFGGTQALFLPSALSDKHVALGGVGGFGLEVAFLRGETSGPVTYFFEIGGAGFGAKANALPSSPDVASGLFIGAGFRAYL